jgi:hypothetical protein
MWGYAIPLLWSMKYTRHKTGSRETGPQLADTLILNLIASRTTRE